MTQWYRPDALEIAAGWVHGRVPQVSSAPLPHRRESPLDALRALLLPALSTPPCTVSFSGGRDSSAVLAAAAHIAREHGLSPPVPLTQVYPGIPEAAESEWQELVVRHLGLSEWLRIEITDELDVLGPISTTSLRELGLLWPGTAHTKTFALEHVPGTTLLTGEGGDEVFGRHRMAPVARLLTRQRLGRHPVRQVVGTFAPAVLRKRVEARRAIPAAWPWLRPAARDAHVRAVVADGLTRALRWDRAVRQTPWTRSWQLGRRNMAAIARRRGVNMIDPLLDERFVDAVAFRGGWQGYPSRAEAMAHAFDDLLPRQVFERRTKATFNRAFFGQHSREFITAWNGQGLNEAYVDPDLVHQAWTQDPPHAASLLLLQSAWLASNSTGG